MKLLNLKIRTYDMGNGWMLDTNINDDLYYEAWIYKKEIGLKSFMFGIPKEENTYEEFLELVEINYEEYKPDYLKEANIYEE